MKFTFMIERPIRRSWAATGQEAAGKLQCTGFCREEKYPTPPLPLGTIVGTQQGLRSSPLSQLQFSPLNHLRSSPPRQPERLSLIT